MRTALALVLALAACGHGADSAATPGPHADPASAGAKDAGISEVEIPARPLGLANIAAFHWRKGAGQGDFVAARKAEHHEDWSAVATTAGAAFASDRGHLEAAWLLAVALAKQGNLDGVLAPLQVAAVGDFGKWGIASLEQPALQPWLKTPVGEAWRRRVEQDRATYAAALARSVIVAADGDLYAFDPETQRVNRVTRTFGAVVAAYAAPDGKQLAYVARGRAKAGLSVGLVDLATGRATRPVPLGAPPPISLAWSTKPAGFWAGAASSWRALDADGKLEPLPGKPSRPPGAWLEVFAHSARLHRLPVANVSADWDNQSLASAMRVGTSNRVVSAPSPGLIDGNTAIWSRDRAHLAFVAQLDDHCTPGAPSVGAAAFVADAATGAVHELERATGGLAVEWVADRKLAIAGDHGVSLVAIDGASAPQVLERAEGLVTPRHKPRCTPETTEETPAPPTTDDEE